MQGLLDRGADINKRNLQGRTPVSVAAQNGHIDVVRLFLDRGANLAAHRDHGSLLSVAAANGHAEVTRLVLNRQHGGTGNSKSHELGKALVLAAKTGSSATMQVLLDYGANPDRLLSTPGVDLQTALIEAAGLGNYEVVNLLLLTSVDVNAVDYRGTALSTAISNHHDAVARLLLKRAGGQVPAAIRHLRSLGQRKQIARLLKIVCQVQKDQREGRDPLLQETSISANMHTLRKHFILQHLLMTTNSSNSSTKFKELSETFPHHRDTWAVGIKTMRNLCRGNIPTNITDTIPFLCLSRAMVDAFKEAHYGDYLEDFNSDLPRWQMLFASDDKTADLEGYRDAIMSMWNVELDNIKPSEFDETILQRFNDLASTLATKADVLYEESSLKGMDTPDARHLESTPFMTPPFPQAEGPVSYTDENSLFSGQEDLSWLHNLPPPQQPWGVPGLTLAEQIKRDPTIIEPLATFLIAGTIFAITVVYLQGNLRKKMSLPSVSLIVKLVLAKLSKLSVSLQVAFPKVKTPAQRYHLLESELIKGRDSVFVQGWCGNNMCVI